jgi:class 3 adenylate cyclase
VRIGVNSGSIVAGIVGTKSLPMTSGDTVNIASRMESNSVTGKINISENTFQLVKNHFTCKYRGQIQVKNKA